MWIYINLSKRHLITGFSHVGFTIDDSVMDINYVIFSFLRISWKYYSIQFKILDTDETTTPVTLNILII